MRSLFCVSTTRQNLALIVCEGSCAVVRRKMLSDKELRIISNDTYVKNDYDAFKLFFDDCIIRNLRPHTIQYYRNEFSAIKRDKYNMKESDIKTLITNMQETGSKTTSINTRLRALRSFF